MIVILNDNTICDNTNLNNPINKKGLVLPSLFKVRSQLYNNKTEINDEPKCNGEECMKDTLFAFFLDGSENINNANSETNNSTNSKSTNSKSTNSKSTNSKTNAKIPIIKTKKKENKKANKKQANKTKKNKQKTTKK